VDEDEPSALTAYRPIGNLAYISSTLDHLRVEIRHDASRTHRMDLVYDAKNKLPKLGRSTEICDPIRLQYLCDMDFATRHEPGGEVVVLGVVQ